MRTGLTLPIVLVIFATLASLLADSRACEIDKMGHGCRINKAQCSCGYGCKAEYRYKDMEECNHALTGKRHNACHSANRCLHGGSCLQITSQPGFKCLCEGTGFFGYRCEKPCPGPENPHHRGPFPYECVVI
ncbi:protein cueball-like [Phymastichus coffea]|uniref:protein cueball-like n=1 Tax=Phymastichus coffea TaxID=108790 RepID=UPI00273B507E|nr:protein cueball-like [Phymastichus coffea]XP_058792781.1 protein cueball-like [Phymastichus coffea]